MTWRLRSALGVFGLWFATVGCDGKTPPRADVVGKSSPARSFDDTGHPQEASAASGEPEAGGPVDKPASDTKAEPAVEASDARPQEGSEVEERAPGLYLLGAGDEPKTKLTLSAKPGDKSTLPLTLDMRLALGVGNKDVPPQDIPTVSLDAVAEVAEVEPSGTTVKVTTQNVSAPDEVESARVAKALKDAVAQLGRASATITFDASGKTTVALEGSADTTRLRPSLDGFFDNLAPTFVGLPTEPVGKGARWEIVTHREEAGAKIQQVVRYTLEQPPGETLALSWELERGTISVTLPEGAGVQAHGANGKGVMEFDPARAAARTAQAQINSRTEARVKFGESPSRVVVHQLSQLAVAER